MIEANISGIRLFERKQE